MIYCFKFLTSKTVTLLASFSRLAFTVSSLSSDFFGFNRLKQDRAITHRLKGIANTIQKKLQTLNASIRERKRILSFISDIIFENRRICNAF